MNNKASQLENLSLDEKRHLLRKLIAQKNNDQHENPDAGGIPEAWYRFEKFPDYNTLMEQEKIFKTLSMNNPYFNPHQGVSDHITRIEGKDFINYSGYNYLGDRKSVV